MAYYSNPEFEKKLRRVVKQHNRLATSGAVHKVMPDGLIVAKPRSITPRFPWFGLVMVLFTVMAFKGFVHYALGAEDFNARAEALANGTFYEQIGGYVMQADPLTVALSQFFTNVLG